VIEAGAGCGFAARRAPAGELWQDPAVAAFGNTTSETGATAREAG
jgi:hypothetical protein